MIIFRYLAKEVLVAMSAVSFSLLLIIMSGRFVKYLAEAAVGDLAGNVLFAIIAFRMPSFLELILPLGLFIGILLAYGRLYVESEMTVLSACGLSTRQLLLYTLIPALLVAALVASMSLWLTPYGMAKVREIQDDPKNKEGLHTMVAGRFKVFGHGDRVSYTRQLNDEKTRMEQVFVAVKAPEPGRPRQMQLTFAESGSLRLDADTGARYLELRDGYRYEVNPGQQAMTVVQFDAIGHLLDDSEKSYRVRDDIDAKPTRELFGSQRLDEIAALQWRLSLPFTVPIVGIIALALSRTNHRQGRYIKMLPAFILYLAYLLLMSAARSGIEDGKIPAQIGVWPVHLAFLLLGFFLLYFDRVVNALRREKTAGSAA